MCKHQVACASALAYVAYYTSQVVAYAASASLLPVGQPAGHEAGHFASLARTLVGC